ncbi:sensor histidine kinase [Sneathiella limimaris]|uniref:sensor histidine kinase n=1 Tax=Sneathiella limimaris TaxID=1964213 RepID=UPI00146CF998|nr:ATP-binding protein [Sneathiella limimaris]
MYRLVSPITLLKVIAVLCFSLQLCFTAAANEKEPTAVKGVLDLRSWDFDKNGRIELGGDWEFYWQQFLDPALIDQSSSTPHFIEAPGTWLGYERDGEVLGKYGYATFRLKVLLPDEPTDLGLYLKRLQVAYRVYVNGQLWMQAGVPGKSASEEVPATMREFASLKGASGTLDIVVHASNHMSYAGGGFFNSFTIGAEADQNLKHLLEVTQDIFLAGALACLGGFLVALHIGRFKERTYFVLYTMCLASAVYMVTVSSSLLELIPSFPYYWLERLSYISAVFLIAFTYEFIHQVNPRKLNHIGSNIIVYLAVLICLFVIFWPYGVPVEIVYAIGFLLLVTSIGSFLEIPSLLRNRVPGAWLIIVGVGILVFAGIHDILNANGIIRSVYLGSYAILVLLLLYAAILALRVNSSITRNEQLAQAIRSLEDGVVIYDGRDQAVMWNDAYMRHLSSAAQKILKPGASFIDLVRADAFSGELLNAVGREQDYIRERMQLHYQPGETFELNRNNRWYLYREAETPDGGRVTLSSDLSLQKTKEAELKKALEELVAANEAKNSFLSNMSHELRTPLNAINGFSDMMIKEVLGPLNGQYRDYAGHISRSGKHLLRLVTDMLDVARIETGKLQVTPEAFDLPAVLEDCVRMEQEKMEARKLSFVKSIPDNLPPLYADPVRVRQIVLNLMDNAIKFTEAGGEISLGVEVDVNGVTTITVRDTGIGIPEDKIEIALQKFGQIRQSHLNAHEGLGLGLSIAQILMQLHGGQLQLKSKLGVGTEVSAIFPAIENAQQFFEQQQVS